MNSVIKFIKILIFIIVVVVLGWGVYDLYLQNQYLSNEVKVLSQELELIEDDNKEIAERIRYFDNPDNLIKELKQQFNYTEEGEELLIIVPKETE